MKTSSECIAKIKEFEGRRLSAYKCSAGVYTIGYGHTQGVKKGQTITEEDADNLLAQDLAMFENYVNGLKLDINQHQFDSLVDFTFNLGTQKLATSTLLKKIRAKAPSGEIQNEFRRWVYVGKTKLQGLVKRREWEALNWVK